MGATTQDMINQLMAQTQVSPQPSFLGIQAPPDPQQLQNLLSSLRKQQFSQEYNRPTGGEYGWLADAGKLAMSSAASDFGKIATAPGGLAGPGPNQVPPPPQAQSAMGNLLMQARAQYAQAIASGVPENDARQSAAKALIQAGVPGAPDVLEKAVAAGTELNLKNSQAGKEDEQKADYKSLEAHRLLEQANWKAEREQKDRALDIQQQNADSAKLKANKAIDYGASPAQSGPLKSAAKDVARYIIPENQVYGRGATMDQKAAFHAMVKAENPDYDMRNFKQSTDAMKAYGPSGTQGQMVLKTQNAMNHLAALKEWGTALDNGDVKQANAMQNYLSKEFGGAPISTYETAAPIVANEVSSGLVKGGGGIEERAERSKELSGAKGNAARDAAIDAMRSLLGAQYQNNKNLYEKTTLRKDFEERFPITGGFPPPPGTSQASTTDAGWQMMPNGVKIRVKQ